MAVNSQRTNRSQEIAAQLEATSHAAVAAHDAHLRQATDSVKWERRGWLGRLAKVRQESGGD
jgi:hypothetical protein